MASVEPASGTDEQLRMQPCGFLLELSPDWLVLRASENVHPFLGQYHVPLIGEPLAEFTLAQPLHDLRNSLARLRSHTGIARAYRVRLIDSPRYFDIAFQLVDSRILLEGVPSPDQDLGSALGSVGRLIDGLEGERQALLNAAARRMRAMTGFDRVSLSLGDDHVESSRGTFPPVTLSRSMHHLPAIVADARAQPVEIYPRNPASTAAHKALLRSPTAAELQELRDQGIRSMLNVPILRRGEPIGCFSCDNRAPLQPTFELHAAAELFAQVFAMRLEMDGRPSAPAAGS